MSGSACIEGYIECSPDGLAFARFEQLLLVAEPLINFVTALRADNNSVAKNKWNNNHCPL